MRSLVLMVLACGLLWRPAVATDWPAYIGRLVPSPSESALSAVLPADLQLKTPAVEVPQAQKRFAGVWRGWACRARFCDIAIAVESVDATEATLVYARAYVGAGNAADRVSGRFIDGELHAEIPNSTRLVLRLRADGDMELTIWGQDGALRAAGVATQKPFGYTRNVERLQTPWTDNAAPQTLELVRYRPTSDGPFPTVLIQHGSTGAGNDPKRFGWTWTSPELATFFTARGWQALFPQRRGRGRSDGTYAEGLRADGGGYSCAPTVSLPGTVRALADIDVVLDALENDVSIKPGGLLSAGVSRGGVLALVAAARQPARFVGAINFVGGWMGDACPQIAEINPVLFRQAGAYAQPTLWIYGEGDPYYSIEHSRSNFDAFTAAGGIGHFESLSGVPGGNGHFVHAFPHMWSKRADQYLDALKTRWK